MKNFAKSARPISPKPDLREKQHGLFNREVVRWNLLYAFFMLIALLAFSLFSSRCLRIIEDNRDATNTIVLETVQVRMDNFMTDIVALGNTLSLSENMYNVMASANSADASRYHLSALVSEFSRYGFLHGSSDGQFIYFPYMDMAMTTSSYGSAQKLYDKRFAESGAGYSPWLEIISREYAGTRLIGVETEDGTNLLMAVRTIHTMSYYTHYCNVVTVIDTDALLASSFKEEMGALFFCDLYNGRVVSPRVGEWEPLLAHGSEMNQATGSFRMRLLEEDMVITYCQSKTTSLIYGIASSEKAYFGFITRLNRILALAVIVYLLVSAGLVVYNACQNYRWIRSISTLTDQNRAMKTRADQQQLAIRHSLLQSLINTSDPLRLPQKPLLESHDIHFQDGYYAVAAFSIDHPRSYLRDLICTVGADRFRRSGLQAYALLENTTVLFLINGGMEYKAFNTALRGALEDIKKGITRGATQPFSLAVSDTVDTQQKLNAAYNNVQRVLDYRDEQGRRVEYFSELTAIPAEAILHYSAETDIRLYSSITNGNAAEAGQVIAEVMADNEKNFLSDGSMLFLTGNLLNTICRAGESALKYTWEAPGEAEVSAIFAERNPQKLRRRLCALAETICGAVQAYRARHRELKNMNAYLSAQSYVLQNFQDVNLSVNSMAEHLDISVSSLSRLFKEESGDNLSAYINRVRTAEAKKCLLDGMRLDDIVEHCGFGSQRTFLRVFKQYVGMTPTQFKDSSGGNNPPPEPSGEES